VTAAAREKVQWQVVSEPAPWADPARDADRRAGLQRGVHLEERWFFSLPPAEQEYALAKAQKAGIAYADVFWDPVSNWREMEPQPGRYDFSKVDTLLEALARHGMRACIMLRTLTGSPPQWHAEKFGRECRLYTIPEDRRRRQPEQTLGINLFHPPTGEALGRFLTAYAAHLKERWGAQVEAIYVEGGQREIEAPEHVSAAMDAFWRAWSKTDTPWRTPESILQDERPDKALAARAEMCREAWLLEYIRRVRAALAQGWREVRTQTMTANDDFHRLYGKATGRSRDAFALAQLTANPCLGTSSPACFHLFSSFARGRWLWSWAIHTGCGITAGADFSHAMLHGVSRITGGQILGRLTRHNYPGNWFRYRDQQFGGFSIGSYIAIPQRAQEIAPIVLNTQRAPAAVAVLWSQASRRLDRSHELFMGAMAWGHLLKRIHVGFDYIAESNLADALANYKVLILPNTQGMPAAAADAIRAWVQRGGAVLAFGAPGLFDELGRRREKLPLADVFGADLARMRVPGVIRPDNLETTHPEGSFVQPPPHPYKFSTDLFAALRPTTGTARAWYAGEENETAIVENTFGEGRALLCGVPIGHEYWESAPYEVAYGLTHHRQTNYNHEQKRYEQWVVKELGKLGVTREVTLPAGRFLRAQRGDDPDWFHTYRNGPEYSEYMFEEERPVRTVTAFVRRREGIDNTYVGLSHTEGNYFWERGYFRCTLSGAFITASVEPPGAGAVVFDARLRVPVPARQRGGRLEFETWLPLAQAAAFALAPGGKVRLFGEGKPTGIGAAELARRAAEYVSGEQLRDVEMLAAEEVRAFIAGLRGTSIVISCADARFKPAGVAVAQWLKQAYNVDSRITMAGPRVSCRKPYMDGFGYPYPGPEPVHAAILIGNCQDNGLMFKFVGITNDTAWVPLEVNQNFPGMGRALVALSSSVRTDGNGVIRKKDAPRQLVLGASFPGEALQAVAALKQAVK